MWTGKLIGIRNDTDYGHDLYVRLAASDLDPKENKNKIRNKVLGSIGGAIVVLLLLGLTIFYFWKKKQKLSAPAPPIVETVKNHELLKIVNDNFKLPFMEFITIVHATDHFSESNKLGEGGFGSVYKGRLLDGQEIAVKRLSKMSRQGNEEFANEVQLIAKLQHINLIRLLGWCVEGEEKMLIYEYLENLSLDTHLFGNPQSLNWQMRFDIINGIAKGMEYIHERSHLQIIHRDLKTTNILLDKDMTPKISDFGMARIFASNEPEPYTRRVVGTYGYMSPEYAMDGIYSKKSDVYSFGVMIIEIVSGKRITGSHTTDPNQLNLVSRAWKYWVESTPLSILDASVRASSLDVKQVIDCIRTALLCVQAAHMRPTISSVISLLNGKEAESLPTPPAYHLVGSSTSRPIDSSSEFEESWTVNQITHSVVDGR